MLTAQEMVKKQRAAKAAQILKEKFRPILEEASKLPDLRSVRVAFEEDDMNVVKQVEFDLEDMGYAVKYIHSYCAHWWKFEVSWAW